jgi:hypothetical protein
MTIIYETINLHNKEHGIYPWRYIGSDQFNNPLYLGSSRDLKKDIEILGLSAFMKIVLEECGDIENKDLRKIEVEKYLKPNKVRSDQSYYNRSETYSPGCGQKGMKHSKKFARTEKWKLSRIGHDVNEDTKKLMSLKKQGTRAKESTKKKMSDQRIGENNHNSLSWTVTTPTGETLNIVALRAWARDNNHNFYDVYHSKNGWKTVKHGTGIGGGRNKKEITSGN